MTEESYHQLAIDIKHWANELGFQQTAITDTHLQQADHHFSQWLAKNYHGEMEYLENNRERRAHPEKLVPYTQRIIVLRMNYLTNNTQSIKILKNKNKAYISRYALGRDYHKKIRKLVTKLAKKIEEKIGPFHYRAFSDSAPVFEKPLAAKAGLGWVGKNTLILNKKAGSWFFLATLYTDLPLPIDQPITEHCGSCTACLDLCPTNAIVAPYQLDARRCISYLTIENKGAIPENLRPLMGNRIFGCDDCQLVCPWNKFSKPTAEEDFTPRHNLDNRELIDLFHWTEIEFLKKTEGSAIRRATYRGWLRNIAVALGNAPTSPEIVQALKSKLLIKDDLVKEHVEWALRQQQ